MANTLNVHGLTTKQMVIADKLWSFDSKAQIDSFIRALPTTAMRQEVQTVYELILMAGVDQHLADTPDDVAIARDMLKSIGVSKHI